MTTTPAEALSVLRDPTIAAPNGFTIRRFTVTVDQDGMGVTTFVDIPAQGAIVPEGSLGVTRAPESETQGSGIEVYTDTPIQTGNAGIGRIADNVIFNGALYEVTSQDDYLQWGFNCAKAVLASPGGRAP
jgi:hypothetical protein